MEKRISELVDTVKDLNRLISILSPCSSGDVTELSTEDALEASDYLEEYKNFILNRKVDI